MQNAVAAQRKSRSVGRTMEQNATQSGEKTGGSAPLVPLCVDLDGTWLKTDSLDECMWAMLSGGLWRAWQVGVGLLRGRAQLKARLAGYGVERVDEWPRNAVVEAQVRAARAAGREVWLVTAADAQIAAAVVRNAPDLFSGWLASDGVRNLKGAEKARALVERFGEGGFDYVGDSRADQAVWAVARQGYRVVRDAQARPWGKEQLWVEAAEPRLRAYRKLIRMHQWSKNGLLWVPLLTAHGFGDGAAVLKVLLGMLCMSLLASGTYILNDLLDLSGDRRHGSKCKRALAAGVVSLRKGALLSVVLVTIAVLGAALLDRQFLVLLLAYAFATVGYSVYAKRILLVDVFMLSGFYVWRLVMGGSLADVELSPWLLGLGFFLFLSLGLAKRYTELAAMAQGSASAGRRAYSPEDRTWVMGFGIGSGLLAGLVMALYVTSDKSLSLYAYPERLWLGSPLLLYWVIRIWAFASRGQLDEDPVKFAMGDRVSWAVLLVLLSLPFFAVGH